MAVTTTAADMMTARAFQGAMAKARRAKSSKNPAMTAWAVLEGGGRWKPRRVARFSASCIAGLLYLFEGEKRSRILGDQRTENRDKRPKKKEQRWPPLSRKP